MDEGFIRKFFELGMLNYSVFFEEVLGNLKRTSLELTQQTIAEREKVRDLQSELVQEQDKLEQKAQEIEEHISTL